VKKPFTAAQNIVWHTAGAVSLIGTYLILSKVGSMKEPFVLGVFAICVIAELFFLRKWVASEFTEEKLKGMLRK
jgi:hypothetical protein